MPRAAITTEIFKTRSNKIHNGKYGYERVKCFNATDKVEIYCPEHKKFFWQSPANHMKGIECPDCGREKCDKARSVSLEEFIDRANILFKNKYDYSKINPDKFRFQKKLLLFAQNIKNLK